MVRSASWLGALLSTAAGLGLARDATALAPCHEVCHLEQGQPLLLAGANTLWVRRCSTAKQPAGTRPSALPACVLERVDLDGRVLEQLPREAAYDDTAFENAHLKGHRIVQLGHRAAWSDLKKPHTFAPSVGPHTRLSLERNELVCTPAGRTAPAGTELRRPLGCAPTAVTVFSGEVGAKSQPEDPTGTVAVVATCKDGSGTREVVAVCRLPL